jgi:predicted ATPase/class 3 adenylate cyclase
MAEPDRGNSPLATGAVTFLFTDIEGSTRLWEEDPERMRLALARHDAISRMTVESHSGTVVKMIGDGMYAAFDDPVDALAAAIDLQRGLADPAATNGVSLLVRCGLHAGVVERRDDDFFGQPLNRAARIMSAAHGGQVLMSQAVVDGVRESLPAGMSLRDIGNVLLKDLSTPEHVYQVVHPDLRQEFPALRSLEATPNNLPQQATSFVGRETELAELKRLLAKTRLVTLTGSGGCGKTRLCLQLAADSLDTFPDGVWLVELAPLTDPRLVPQTVATVLGLKEAPGKPIAQTLSDYLRDKQLLLILDNCEHLLDACAQLADTLVRQCPQVTMIASSREALGIGGEQAYRVPSLSLPDPKQAHTPASVAPFEAVQLFTDRAVLARSDFAVTAQNASAIASICYRLDGIPLAIELAAARLRSLSVEEINRNLNQRFRLLTGGSRTALPRQRTLQALIDWSHDLLDERERVLFRRIAIFVNGFTPEGAAAVAAGNGEGVDQLDVLDMLASLVDKSLVLAEPHGDALRYRLLESMRAYGSEKLSASGERDLIAGRHLLYLRDRFAQLREIGERTIRWTEYNDALAAELEDIRVALDWALERPEVVRGSELLSGIKGAWAVFGLYREGIARNEQFLAALPGTETRLLARLSITVAGLRNETDLFEDRALKMATEAIAHARTSGDGPTLADALDVYAYANIYLAKPDDAETALDEAEAIPGLSAWRRVRFLATRASLCDERGDFDSEARLLTQLREEYRSRGNARLEQYAAKNLAACEYARGQTQRAIALVREILPAARHGTDRQLIANLLLVLSTFLAAVDDLSAVAESAGEAIALLASSEPDHVNVAIALEQLALVDAVHGDLKRAATLEGYAAAAIQRHGYARMTNETMAYNRLSTLLHEGLAPDELTRLSAEGAALKPEAAIALTLRGPYTWQLA